MSTSPAVAISDDGDRVYVNTGDGVHYVDASPLDEGGDLGLPRDDLVDDRADGLVDEREPDLVRGAHRRPVSPLPSPRRAGGEKIAGMRVLR